MRVLFDNGVPRGLARLLVGHEVVEARARGWDLLSNGKLIQAAEDAGFEVFLSNDTEIRYQQNLSSRRIAIVVLTSSQWPGVRAMGAAILEAVDASHPGSFSEVEIPVRKKRSL